MIFSVSTDCGDGLKVALWSLKAIASECGVKFIQSAENCGYSILTQKIDEATAGNCCSNVIQFVFLIPMTLPMTKLVWLGDVDKAEIGR